MSFPPGVKCWTPDGQDLGVRLRALDGTSNISGDEGRSYNVGEDRTVVVHSKDVAPLTAGGKFERVEDTSADKVTVRSYTASDLDGLTFPEAFQKFVIGPVAEAFQRFMFERGGLPGEDFLKDGSLFGPLLKHGRLGGIGSSLWPVDLDKLISRVPPSSAIRHLIRLIVERWGALIEFLRQGDLVATDIDDYPLPVGYWKRKGMSVDIETGDVFEVGKNEPLRRGLALSFLPKTEDLPKTADRDPGGAPAKYLWESLPKKLPILMSRKGRPETKTELIGWVQDFLALPDGAVPDEADVRKYLKTNFPELYEDASKNAGKK